MRRRFPDVRATRSLGMTGTNAVYSLRVVGGVFSFKLFIAKHHRKRQWAAVHLCWVLQRTVGTVDIFKMCVSRGVRSALHELGIKVREKSRPHGRPSQTKFGEKLVAGKLALDAREQRIISAIREMREQGLSLRQIAKTLEIMGMPTKEHGKRWHPEMVRRISDGI